MLTSLFGRCIGVSTVVCVLLLFFFPLAQGNFQSTHGPVTALRSKRSFLMIFFSMMLAALRVLASRLTAAFWRRFSSSAHREGDFGRLDDSGCLSVLRC